jgi:hypothetical protein
MEMKKMNSKNNLEMNNKIEICNEGKKAYDIPGLNTRRQRGVAGGEEKNQKKNKKSLTEAAWRCITRSRRCGTECLAEPGRAERPGRRGEQVF